MNFFETIFFGTVNDLSAIHSAGLTCFELKLDVFFGIGGGGSRPDTLLELEPELELEVVKVTEVEVGVPASCGRGGIEGCDPFRNVIGTVSDDVTIIAAGADLAGPVGRPSVGMVSGGVVGELALQTVV